MSEEMIRCNVCPHSCLLAPGATGRCRARRHVKDESGNRIVSLNYGIATSLALDPIEKKPLNRFYPGAYILSVGSFGCNLSCPFCQNHEISASDGNRFMHEDNRLSPDELTDIAVNTVNKGNIGIAFTYNEPLIGYEYVLDTAKLAKKAGLKTVLVTAGCINKDISDKILPHIDALNIDLKSYNKHVYRDILGGNLDTVKRFIKDAASMCHVEITTLIVPGLNDSEDEMKEICTFISSLPNGKDIPFHISRFFPRHKMTDRHATDVSLILKLAQLAQGYLNYVYPGNI